MEPDKNQIISPEEYTKKLKDQAASSQTVIAQGTKIIGTIVCQDQLIVMGRVEGDIDCAGIVLIESQAKIKANIYARKVVINGDVQGDVVSAEYVEIKPEGRFTGNLKAARIRLISGCFFEGEVRMLRESLDSGVVKPEKSGEKGRKK